jgi:hypothetical protein
MKFIITLIFILCSVSLIYSERPKDVEGYKALKWYDTTNRIVEVYSNEINSIDPYICIAYYDQDKYISRIFFHVDENRLYQTEVFFKEDGEKFKTAMLNKLQKDFGIWDSSGQSDYTFGDDWKKQGCWVQWFFKSTTITLYWEEWDYTIMGHATYTKSLTFESTKYKEDELKKTEKEASY